MVETKEWWIIQDGVPRKVKCSRHQSGSSSGEWHTTDGVIGSLHEGVNIFETEAIALAVQLNNVQATIERLERQKRILLKRSMELIVEATEKGKH